MLRKWVRRGEGDMIRLDLFVCGMVVVVVVFESWYLVGG